MSDNIIPLFGHLHSLEDKLDEKDMAHGGGSGYNGEMEGRLGKLEGLYEGIEKRLGLVETGLHDHRAATDRDFRILFGAIIAVALGLAGLMATGFGWL